MNYRVIYISPMGLELGTSHKQPPPPNPLPLESSLKGNHNVIYIQFYHKIYKNKHFG